MSCCRRGVAGAVSRAQQATGSKHDRAASRAHMANTQGPCGGQAATRTTRTRYTGQPRKGCMARAQDTLGRHARGA